MTLKMPSIPRARYIDEGFYQAEIDYVFKTQWLFVAHSSEFEKAGCYQSLELPFAPVFVVLGKDGEYRAFLNSCRHRGASVLKDKGGCAAAFTCPYHSWTYDLTGKLKGLPSAESFGELNKADYSLIQLRCELWGGCIFINFDPDATPLLDWLGEVDKKYGEIMAAPLRLFSRRSLTIECNWKLVYEAFRESYHVASIHKATLAPLVDSFANCFDTYSGGHNTSYARYWKNINELTDSTDWVKSTQQTGLSPLPKSDQPEFMGSFLSVGIFPNLNIPYQTTAIPIQTMWPLSKDKSRMDVLWLGMDWGGRDTTGEWDQLMTAFDMAFEEDLSNLCSIQKSVEASPELTMPLSNHEFLLYQLHSELDRHIPEGIIKEELRLARVECPAHLDMKK